MAHNNSSHPAQKRYPPELVAYMQSRSGRQKVMFGTNWPMIAPEKALEGLDAQTTSVIKEVLRAWARRGGAVVGTGYLDTHKVRTLGETLLVEPSRLGHHGRPAPAKSLRLPEQQTC